MIKEEKIKFFKEATLFLICLIIFMLILNAIYFKVFIEKKQLYRTEIEFQEFIRSKGERNISYLFLGSSHTKDGGNPASINDSFNIATGGEGTYVFAYYKLRKIIEKDKIKVGTLVVEIDPHILNDRAYPIPFPTENLWYWSDFFSYKEIKDITALSHPDYLAQSKLYFMNGAKDFNIFLNKEEKSETFRGWNLNENNLSNEKDPKDYADQYFKVTFKNINSSLNLIGTDYLLRIAKLAKNNNASIVLVKYPLSKEYIERIDESGFDQNNYYKNIFSLLEKNGIGYKFLDYQEIFQNSDYFADVGHLNAEGAGVFSSLMERDIKKNNMTTIANF